MIVEIIAGDITSLNNRADIIIGMNARLTDVTGIGGPFVNKISTLHPIDLGSVLSFKFDSDRNLHMLICHKIGKDGWKYADKHVRYGLDYLWHTERKREFSIVQIGTGRVGVRDSADSAAIHTAIATSFLPVKLFIYDPKETVAVVSVREKPMQAYRAWHPVMGEEKIRIAA